MTAEEYEGLKASIKERGQEVPILLLNGQILDGRHRYLACQELGIDPVITEIDTADPLGLVFTLNLQRRHLDKGQIAMIAARVTARDGRKPDRQILTFPSAQAAADAVNVSRSYISEAIDVLEFDEECGGSLASQVLSGERRLWDAHGYVRKERERLKKKAKAHVEVEKLSKPAPVLPPYKPEPRSDDAPSYAEEMLEGAEASADPVSLPGSEAFQEYIDRQDPVKLRRATWGSNVGRSTATIVTLWNSLEAMARDKRTEDWEMLPEEQESIDALRKVAKEASKRFRRGGVVYFKPAKIVVEGNHE
jgi:ParB-like chromosome segregation protein Spo0J